MIAPLLAAAALLGATTGVGAAGPASAPEAWAPDVAAARAYARTRPGVIAFAVRTEDHL